MTDAIYRNHQHYITEGWSSEPKETFKALRAIIEKERGLSSLRVLDVGCATGELLGYLSTQLIDSRYTGVDVSNDLIETGKRLLPQAEFRLASALDLPGDFSGSFDVVCAIGCMSIFDENQIDLFWENLLRVAKHDGLVIVLSPLNEYGVDTMTRHRKRHTGILGEWETGWNIFSQDTIKEIINKHGVTIKMQHFQIPFDLAAKEDPVRTWTIKTEFNERQLTNGLKLLVDHYFIIVQA